MLLKSLHLHNIRSYLDTSIEFPEGSILLAGDIGSGKSSILLAIEFALFGILRGDLSGEALLRKGKQQGSVEFTFSLAGKDITIKRSLKKSTNGVQQDAGYIFMDDRKFEGTAQELKARMLELLGYPKELERKSKSLIYRFTVYTPQEQMRQILLEKEEERIDTLRKVFGIDQYKRITENTEIFVKFVKEQKKLLEQGLLDYEERQQQRKSLQQEWEQASQQWKEMQAKFHAEQRKERECKEKMQELENKVKTFQQKQQQLEVADAKLREKTSLRERQEKQKLGWEEEVVKCKQELALWKKEALDTMEGVEQRVRALEDKIQQKLLQRAELQHQLTSAQAMQAELQKEIQEKEKHHAATALLEKEAKLLEEKLQGKEKRKQEIKETAEKLQHAQQQWQHLFLQAEEHGALLKQIHALQECPLCRQNVSDKHKEQLHFAMEEKAERWRQEQGKLEKEMVVLKKLLEELQEQEEQFLEMQQEYAELQGTLKAAKEHAMELEEKRKKMQAMREQIEKISLQRKGFSEEEVEHWKKQLQAERTLQKQLQEYQSKRQLLEEKQRQLQQVSQLLKELEEGRILLMQQQHALQKELLGYQGVEEKFEHARKEHEEQLQRLRAVEVQVAALQEKVKGLQRLLETLEKELQKKEQQKQELEQWKQLQHWFENFFVPLITTIEKHVMLAVQREFNALFQNWFNILVEDETLQARLDDRFNPVVEQNGYETEVENLSGGEKTAMALAYRLSLNKVINQLMSTIQTKDLIILDEPTDGFSTEQLDKVRDVLEQLNMKQVIIVSHETKIESFVDHVIRIEKQEHVSRVVG
ncbi:SMC family ATPase [Candidatus Woesearchaeota archaeon]|nr:SMC family ATPase [Candidatus Woesearchaeota archaeon]